MFSPRLKLDRQSAFWPDASRHRVDGEQRRFAAIDAAIAFNTIVLAESAGDFGTGIIPPGERYQVLKPLELATEAIDKDPDALHAYAAQAKAFMLLGRDREARAAFANLCGRLSAIDQIMKRSLHRVR